jgi:hypothetical protein
VRRPIVATVLALALLPAGAAGASVYTDVLHTYQASGSIPPCRFSSAQLSTALKGIDTYGQQYFADFSDAVQNALAARASGACAPATLRAAIAARRSHRTGPAPALPSTLTAPTNADLPAPILLMAAVAIAAAAVLALRALVLAGGWEPEWALRWRHAWGEAAYRAGGGWADLRDRLRRGR